MLYALECTKANGKKVVVYIGLDRSQYKVIKEFCGLAISPVTNLTITSAKKEED